MKRNTGELTFMALMASALLVGGYMLYILSKTIPLPGSKFLVMAPYLSLVMYLSLKHTRRPWTMTIISTVFGIVISIFSLFMGIAIIGAGIFSDLTGLIIPNHYSTERSIKIASSSYAFWSFAVSLFITDFVTGNILYGVFGPITFIFMGVLIFSLGYLGTLFGGITSLRIKKGGEVRD
ncbi:energy-coupling factor transport system substrate-specific component [Acetoanaerobium pronyense]|uniref:Energy-coupling factor transport system substrate-specific component n=1 Tax=Acetoanaerobium pronyense TaxID=1482736 RepID=A0ABS4KGK1_9FIRM|nr:hypothetical protein [Acetoanaerobium pronyense]MBP2026908.1 energy-coupling factor transport system substrate-specific component [Acetoanaerobium pronyense]